MALMQPVNFQHNIQNRPNTTNSVPTAYRQRVQAAIADDSLHPSKYLSFCQNVKSPEFESQDWLVNRSPTFAMKMSAYPFLQHFYTDTAALQI